MALGRRQPAAGLRHHSDRGRPYASHTYQDLLATQGSVCRLRRPGECLDNAVAERCFGSFTREWTAHRYDATRPKARDEMIADIEIFDNSRRKHSSLGYGSPNAYEQCARVASLGVRFSLTTTA